MKRLRELAAVALFAFVVLGIFVALPTVFVYKCRADMRASANQERIAKALETISVNIAMIEIQMEPKFNPTTGKYVINIGGFGGPSNSGSPAEPMVYKSPRGAIARAQRGQEKPSRAAFAPAAPVLAKSPVHPEPTDWCAAATDKRACAATVEDYLNGFMKAGRLAR